MSSSSPLTVLSPRTPCENPHPQYHKHISQCWDQCHRCTYRFAAQLLAIGLKVVWCGGGGCYYKHGFSRIQSNSNMVIIHIFAICYLRLPWGKYARTMFTPTMFSRGRNLLCGDFARQCHTCHILPPSEIDLGLSWADFAGSGGKHLLHRIGWKGRIWQIWVLSPQALQALDLVVSLGVGVERVVEGLYYCII